MTEILASQDDVEARLRRGLTADESSYIDELLEEASSVVIEHCGGREFGEPVPDAVRIVTSRICARALTATDLGGVQSLTNQAGPQFVQTRVYTPDSANGAVYLTAVDRKQLRRWSRRRVESFYTR